jgi:hypothetical protein
LVDSGPHTVENDSRQDLAGNGQQHIITLVVRVSTCPYMVRTVRIMEGLSVSVLFRTKPKTAKCPYIPQKSGCPYQLSIFFFSKTLIFVKCIRKTYENYKKIPKNIMKKNLNLAFGANFISSSSPILITPYFCKILQISCNFSFKHCFEKHQINKENDENM